MKSLASAFKIFAATWLAISAPAYAGKVYDVCHGELDSRCLAHHYDYHEACSQPPGVKGGIDPRQTTSFLCGVKPGGIPNGHATQSFPSEPGNACGYAWVKVTCDDD